MNNSSFPCIPDFTYFDSPEFVTLALHIVSIISTPIYCLGVYCILFKTPKQMNSVKFQLFCLHFWIILFDYAVAVLTIPYLMIPVVGGIGYGLLSWIGVPLDVQTLFVLIVFTFIFSCILFICENRFHILCEFRWKDQWAFWRKVWVMLHYAKALSVWIPMYALIPDQKKSREEALQILPCLPDFLSNGPNFVLATEYGYQLTVVLASLVECFLEVAFFINQLIKNGREHQKTKRLSEKTFKMHKQFLLAVFVQITVPLIMIAAPTFWVILSIPFHYATQASVNVSVITATLHGLVSTIVMIIVHAPYRLAVRKMIGIDDEKKKELKVSVLSVDSQKAPNVLIT